MTQKYEKLKTLLKELFQLDQPDLDFGLYRIMHAKSAEVSQFLDEDLLPQVKEAFALYQTADKAEIQKELAKAIEQAQGLGVDPETTQKVKDLRARIASEAVDIGQLEAEVYDHLFRFFRRYYSEGDFLSRRVYKPGVYAIPYEGEEVKLHWANADQYYIKTSEYLRDYAFRLRPDDEARPMRVHFRLVDAAEGEHGNVKATEGKDRRFKLAESDPVAIEGGELVIRFTYQPDPDSKRKQKDLNAAAEGAILGLEDAALSDWREHLGAKHVRADGTAADSTRLRVHLDRYTARNTFDYFIHKDLGGFLRRELDFYIKNEVMHLDDIENDTAPRVEQYLSKIKVIRRIAGKIIAFLAQLEDFQKKLWLKKKFVVETSYCIRLGVIPEELYPEIAANDAQREEWVRLCASDELKSTAASLLEPGKPGYSVPLTPEFLKAHPTLMLDTRSFDGAFNARLLEAVGDVDAQTDGVLFHSENFQALSLMQARYREQVKCIYIDPPYNTGQDGFSYKDQYQRSSWLSFLLDRILASRNLLSNDGLFFSSIDFLEESRLREIADQAFSADGFLAKVIWEKRFTRSNNAKLFATLTESVLAYRKSADTDTLREPRSEKADSIYSNPDNDSRGPWTSVSYVNPAKREDRPNLSYPLVNPVTGEEVSHPTNAWKYEKTTYERHIAENRLYWGPKGEHSYPRLKKFLSEMEGMVPVDLWKHGDTGTTDFASKLLEDEFGAKVFEFPKPPSLIRRIAALAGFGAAGGTFLDFFAGTAPTGHAVINLNREDGGRRKFILVEQGDHFDTVLLPRLKKVTFSPEWKDGKPKRLATPEEAERSPRILKVVRLESYEDALNNLAPQRSDAQEKLLFSPDAQGPDGLKEQYVLRYMLDVETRGSQSLLNVEAFSDPTAYTLKVKRPGSDESREVNVDLLETFDWLIGLTVQHIAAPQTFRAAFERDSEGRLRLKGRLEQDADGPFWFRTVTGTTPDGRRTLVIWRKRPGGESAEGIEQDNLVLDEWFTKQGYSSKDSEFDLIYVNGGNNLENLKTPDDLWKVRLIEADFQRLMFEAEGS